jgi:glycosyltransferase involved in cell wall biosynthesis
MKISVVCPVYDTPEEILQQAVNSVFRQDIHQECEVILVDDTSNNPGTIACLQRLKASYDRIKLIRLPANKGPSSARAAGIRVASGEWIGFLDSDDNWLPGALQHFRNTMAAAPQARWIVGHYQTLHDSGVVKKNPRVSEEVPGKAVARGVIRITGPALTRHLIGSSRFHIGATLIDRSLLGQVTDFGFTEGLLYNEDWLLWVRLSVICDLYFMNAETYQLRRDRRSVVMGSSRRLTYRLLSALKIAKRDPSLKPFQREIRWATYGTAKGLALNNMLSGLPVRAAWFAVKAYMIDPREIADLVRFIRLTRMSQAERLIAGSAYSRLEQFIAPGQTFQ